VPRFALLGGAAGLLPGFACQLFLQGAASLRYSTVIRYSE
jgi:hypothetical protein